MPWEEIFLSQEERVLFGQQETILPERYPEFTKEDISIDLFWQTKLRYVEFEYVDENNLTFQRVESTNEIPVGDELTIDNLGILSKVTVEGKTYVLDVKKTEDELLGRESNACPKVIKVFYVSQEEMKVNHLSCGNDIAQSDILLGNAGDSVSEEDLVKEIEGFSWKKLFVWTKRKMRQGNYIFGQDEFVNVEYVPTQVDRQDYLIDKKTGDVLRTVTKITIEAPYKAERNIALAPGQVTVNGIKYRFSSFEQETFDVCVDNEVVVNNFYEEVVDDVL